MNNPFTIIKNSITFVVLFWFGFLGKAFGMDCVRDTIIIDGKTVVVERVVDYAAPELEEPELPMNPSTEMKSDGYFLVGPSISSRITSNSTQSENMLMLGDFIDKPGKISGGVGIDLFYGCRYRESIFGWEVGISFDHDIFRNKYFAESALDDSLYQFTSPAAGQLQQIARHDLVIGVEFYDVDAILLKSNLTYSDICFHGNLAMYHKINRSTHLETRLGGGYNIPFGMRGGPIVLVNEDAEYKYISPDELPLNHQITGYIGIDIKVRIQHKVPAYHGFGLWWAPSFSPLFSENPEFNQNAGRFGLRYTINFFSKQSKNKVAQ